jgi:hypothetical protein
MNNVNGQVLIMLAPNESAYQQISNIPPLALGVLKGYLTEKGIRTEIYDLNVTLSKCASKLPLTIWSFVYDSQRVMSYLKGESDQEIDNALSRLVSGIDFTVYDLIGISMGADFSWLEMHGGMLLVKWIHDKYKVPVEIGGNNVHYLLQFKNGIVGCIIQCRFIYLCRTWRKITCLYKLYINLNDTYCTSWHTSCFGGNSFLNDRENFVR